MARAALLLLVLTAAACGGRERLDPCAFAAPGAPWLAYSTARGGSYDLAVVRLDGSCGRTVTADAGQELFPTWSPAGAIAFASDRDGALGIRVLDLDGGTETAIDLGGLRATYPAFAPDGSRLAFEGSTGGTTSQVYVVGSGGAAPVALTDDPSANGGPAWSADGATVYFVSNRTGAHEIHAVPAGGGSTVQVTSGSRIVGRPALLPDGATIAWTRTASGGTEVVTRPISGGAPAVLSGPGDSEIAFSRDPSAPAVVRSYRYGATELVAVDPAGILPAARVTFDGAACGAPAFAPPP
jgi:TolB protein